MVMTPRQWQKTALTQDSSQDTIGFFQAQQKFLQFRTFPPLDSTMMERNTLKRNAFPVSFGSVLWQCISLFVFQEI
ncbi:MAG: hypothetical protein ACOVSW_19460 [Candidatus Kapaibacteriota bacterium]